MSEDHEAGEQGSESTGDPDLDRQVADLEHSGEKVEDHIDDAKRDWEAKQQDPGVPGAVGEEEEDKPQAAQSEHGDSPAQAGQ